MQSNRIARLAQGPGARAGAGEGDQGPGQASDPAGRRSRQARGDRHQGARADPGDRRRDAAQAGAALRARALQGGAQQRHDAHDALLRRHRGFPVRQHRARARRRRQAQRGAAAPDRQSCSAIRTWPPTTRRSRPSSGWRGSTGRRRPAAGAAGGRTRRPRAASVSAPASHLTDRPQATTIRATATGERGRVDADRWSGISSWAPRRWLIVAVLVGIRAALWARRRRGDVADGALGRHHHRRRVRHGSRRRRHAADYKDAERAPTDLAAGLYSILREGEGDARRLGRAGPVGAAAPPDRHRHVAAGRHRRGQLAHLPGGDRGPVRDVHGARRVRRPGELHRPPARGAGGTAQVAAARSITCSARSSCPRRTR